MNIHQVVLPPLSTIPLYQRPAIEKTIQVFRCHECGTECFSTHVLVGEWQRLMKRRVETGMADSESDCRILCEPCLARLGWDGYCLQLEDMTPSPFSKAAMN
jgi:hypothetical protein